jgi:hypothetical protein
VALLPALELQFDSEEAMPPMEHLPFVGLAQASRLAFLDHLGHL